MVVRVCLDKINPKKIPSRYQERAETVHSLSPPLSMAVLFEKAWTKRNLKVRFLNGDPQIQKKVEQYAKEWEQHARMKLNFVSDNDADIRVGFKWNGDLGSWSFLGDDAEELTDLGEVPRDEPTMNYGWLERDTDDNEYSRTVCHEFGHALGAIHEHQNPGAVIKWNKDAVYKWFAENTDWTREQVDHNLFERYDKTIANFTTFDPQSIMIYPIPAEWTQNGEAIGLGVNKISKLDIELMKKMYP
jgi:serralysin